MESKHDGRNWRRGDLKRESCEKLEQSEPFFWVILVIGCWDSQIPSSRLDDPSNIPTPLVSGDRSCLRY